MKQPQLPPRARLLVAVILLLTLVISGLIGLLFWSNIRVKGNEMKTAIVQGATDVIRSSDLLPDATRLFQRYDGLMTDGKGNEIRLSSFRGSPVILLFWSSWCTDCEAYMKVGLPSALTAAAEKNVPFHLVCREGVHDDNYAQAKEKLRALKISQDTWMDPKAELFHTFGLHSVPSLAVIDEAGKLRITTIELPEREKMNGIIDLLKKGALPLLDKFTRNLIRMDGSMASVYHLERDRLIPGDTVLSETQGLLMAYAVRQKDQALFEQVWGYTQRNLLREGEILWRNKEGRKTAVNAALDDLRIVDALLAAEELWGGYQAQAETLAQALYDSCVHQGRLVDFSGLGGKTKAEQISLSYQHPAALRRLAKLDERWEEVADQAETLLRGGRISDEFPLYWPTYAIKSGLYSGKNLHMAEALVTVLHAAQANIMDEKTLNWLEERLQKGPIYARYDTNGRVVPGYGYESTAIYALAAQIGQETGQTEITRLAMARMEQFRCYQGMLAGSYGNEQDRSFYAYDVLQALLAWQQANQQRAGG